MVDVESDLFEFIRSEFEVSEFGPWMRRVEFFEMFKHWCWKRGKPVYTKGPVYRALDASLRIKGCGVKLACVSTGNYVLKGVLPVKL